MSAVRIIVRLSEAIEFGARESVGGARGVAASAPEIQRRMGWRNIFLDKELLVRFRCLGGR